MKTRWLSFLSLCLFLIGLLGLSSSASALLSPDIVTSAQTRACFTKTGAIAAAQGDGVIRISLDFEGIATMQEIGASKVCVYERQSDGTERKICTCEATKYPILMGYHCLLMRPRLTCQGTPGRYYYATVLCSAKKATGSQAMWIRSNLVRAF